MFGHTLGRDSGTSVGKSVAVPGTHSQGDLRHPVNESPPCLQVNTGCEQQLGEGSAIPHKAGEARQTATDALPARRSFFSHRSITEMNTSQGAGLVSKGERCLSWRTQSYYLLTVSIPLASSRSSLGLYLKLREPPCSASALWGPSEKGMSSQKRTF